MIYYYNHKLKKLFGERLELVCSILSNVQFKISLFGEIEFYHTINYKFYEFYHPRNKVFDIKLNINHQKRIFLPRIFLPIIATVYRSRKFKKIKSLKINRKIWKTFEQEVKIQID